MRKQVGQLHRLDHGSCELFEVIKVEDFDGADRVTYRSCNTLSIRVWDDMKDGLLPSQGPELQFVVHVGAQFFERTHIYFSRYTDKIGAPGDDIEYFKDTRNGRTYIVAVNEEKPVFQVAEFVNLRFDERSRMATEMTYDAIENIAIFRGPQVYDIPFMLGWVKCWGIDDDLPTDFDFNSVVLARASDGAAVLAVLERDGRL